MDKHKIEDFYAEVKAKKATPKADSWDKVEALIDEKKKPRPIIWWWTGSAASIAAAAVLALIIWDFPVKQDDAFPEVPSGIELPGKGLSKDSSAPLENATREDLRFAAPAEVEESSNAQTGSDQSAQELPAAEESALEIVEDYLFMEEEPINEVIVTAKKPVHKSRKTTVTYSTHSIADAESTVNPSNNSNVRGARSGSEVVFVDGVRMKGNTSIKKNKRNGWFSKKSKKETSTEYMEPPVATNESYNRPEERSYSQAVTEPLSTFSIDVDRAGYSNVRRMINNGYLPPADAVRAEEMVNYFDYAYDGPKDEHPLALHGEVMVSPWDSEKQLLKLAVQGERLDMSEMPPSNIVFLLDVSGSMSDQNKLPLLKSSLAMLVEKLRPQDRIAIVVYAGSSGLVLPSTSAKHKEKILTALNNLEAGGSTAGGAGLRLAYKVALENFKKNGNNRIILATDGDFNVGQSSDQDMEDLIVEHRDKGIEISVLGFGMGNYKDSKMEIIANKGNGNYAYIDNLLEAKKTLVTEFGGTLFTIAKDVKIQVEFNPAYVKEYRLIGYETRALANEDFTNDKKDAGEVGAGHTVTAIYEIVPVNATLVGEDGLKYSETKLSQAALESGEIATMKVRYKEPGGTESTEIQLPIKRDVKTTETASENMKFAVAVAEFALLLMDSEYKGSASYEQVLELAKSGKGDDPEGYRAEFIRLVEIAQLLSKSEY